MAGILVTFACGHRQDAGQGAGPCAICVICGEPRIRRVHAPPPTIRGVAAGPLVQFALLPPEPRTLRSGPPLIKDTKESR